MDGVDPKAFEFALSKIEDGFVFEKFAQDFLSKVLSYDFLPAGRLKDRAIDGLEHLFHRKGYKRNIYQMSIVKCCEEKLESTLKTLKKNGVKFELLYYVTNQNFPNKDKVIDRLYEEYKKPINIYDLGWFASKVNTSQATVNSYHTFVSSYLHEFNQPGKSYVVGDLIGDPRLFVFLRQQWDADRKDLTLDEILADTLILYCLEGTDPDKGIFKTQQEIKQDITKYIRFDPKLIYGTIDRRLDELSRKPRHIKYHSKDKGYCLPYETRVEIQERNLTDAALYEAFKLESEKKLKAHLKNAEIKVRDCLSLIETMINQLFYKQGLEFADFVLHGENQQAFDKELPDIISSVVDQSSVVLKNKDEVKTSLLITIREIVFNGTTEQKYFLNRLSNTYMMLFLLQCDPKLCTFFNTMASKLNIYVCTSIIIPALSEFYLEPINRRYWNLLKGAHNTGVTLTVNETIINELVSHFRMIMSKYESEYKDNEDIYLGDELEILYIDNIMIRAYFYAKMKNKIHSFYDFIDNFINPNLKSAETDIIEWLKEEFGIVYTSDKSHGIKINSEEEETLYNELKPHKSADEKARNDAKLILTLYAIREKNNETGDSGIFGYRTWWLSSDTATQRAVNKVLGHKYRISCYIRPDFLYNYISLAPTKIEVDAAYQQLFPSLIGVNISFHLPKDVTDLVHQRIAEHKSRNPARLKAILRDLAEKIKSDPACRTRKFVQHYLDEKLNEKVTSKE